MAHIESRMMTNNQVSLQWPPRRRHSRGAFTRLLFRLRSWRLRTRQRDELARLDERNLQDIGRSTADAYREAAKWFWEE
jgi:uncharacterized protein YjiS (DUF1127 family)